MFTLAMVLAAAFLFPKLNDIPGLNADEAWFGLRARAIAAGDRPLCGLNFYTGALYPYVLALFLETFGYSVGVMRLLSAVAGLASLGLYWLVLRRLFGRVTAACAALLLASSPWFIMQGRVATEHFALNPLLALAAVYSMLRAYDARGRTRLIWAGIAAVMFGFGVWNHIIMVAVVAVGVLLIWLTVKDRRARALMLGSAGVGGALGIIIHVWCARAGFPGGWFALSYAVFAGFLSRLTEWPYLFLTLIQGDILFRRYAGGVLLTIPLYSAALFIGAVIVVARRSMAAGTSHRYVLIACAALFLATLSISSGNSDRYFLLPLYGVPVILALSFSEVIQNKRMRVYGWAALGIFIALNIVRITRNYYVGFEALKGQPAYYSMGSKPETTHHLVRSRKLYDILTAVGAQRVVTNFMIGMPLKFYDIEGRRFAEVEVRDGFPRGMDKPLIPGTYAVTYSERAHRDIMDAFRGAVLIREEEDFLIYKVIQ